MRWSIAQTDKFMRAWILLDRLDRDGRHFSVWNAATVAQSACPGGKSAKRGARLLSFADQDQHRVQPLNRQIVRRSFH
jgi:hypothetical protein